MLNKLIIKTRKRGYSIKLNHSLNLVYTLKDIYSLDVLYLKRNYSDSIVKKVNSEEVFIKKLISKEAKKTYQSDLILDKKINLNKKSSNLELNFIIKEKEWKEIWNQKFNKYKKIGKYLPTISDKLFFSYLQERKLNLKTKYTFNNFLSSSKIINYNFQKTNKKVDLNSLYKLLKSFFKTLKSLISFPILKITPEKLKILLFYYVIPSKSILRAKQNYNKYIRKDEKLFKDTILRTKLIKIMSRFKMILFISKWKENNNIIKLPNLNNKTSSLSIPLVYKIQDGYISNLENTNLTNQEVAMLRDLGLNLSEVNEKNIAIFSIKTIQYNLSKLIPFYKNLATLLFEKDLNLLKDNKKKLKILNFNNSIEINQILTNNLLKKISLNKDLNINKFTEKFENLNIGINIDKEKKLINLSSIDKYIGKKILEVNINNLQFENRDILNNLINTSLYKIAQELILIYSELNLLKEKIKNQEIFKKNYKKDIVYSLIYLNKLVFFFIKLKNYKIQLAAKQKEFNNSNYENLENLNFEIEGLEELNLENLYKFYNSYSNLKINRKLFKILQEKKDICNYLNLPSITEILSLIKEQNFEFSEEPLIMNYSNPYAYKNANLLLITALHSLYRAILIEHLNKITTEEKIGSEKEIQKRLPINELDKFNIKDLKLKDSFKKIRVNIENLDREMVVDNSKKNILSNIKSNNGSSLISLNKIKFKYLISYLEKIFNKSIELELIRLKYPAHNSNILAQVLAISSKNLKFFTIMKKLLYNVNIKQTGVLKNNFNVIPSFLSGIKIRLGGRLSTEKLIPRKTVKTFQMGSIARNKTNFKEKTIITLKNKRGAYSFTVITSHIFNTKNKIKY